MLDTQSWRSAAACCTSNTFHMCCGALSMLQTDFMNYTAEDTGGTPTCSPALKVRSTVLPVT